MKPKEIKILELNAGKFIRGKVEEILKTVGSNSAITALSGGVDSVTVALLGYKALGKRLKVVFIDNGLMRENEPQEVASMFEELEIPIEIIDAKKQFFNALEGVTNPEQKREVVTQTFYKKVFTKLIRESGAKCLLQGTILTDIEETIAGIKRQHNVFKQLGIDPEKAFGYKIIEPLRQLRKDGVRKIAKALGLPKSIYKRMPFPGPALSARIIGEVTPERIKIIRKTTAIVEEELKESGAFQYLAILHHDRVTGIRDRKRDFGLQIEIRCWESVDARTAVPTRLPYDILETLAKRITNEVPGVTSVTYNITSKPPSTMEAI
ncbi:ExsB family transcriptional regulator [Patescibacteria group bacterium]|nr:ExsB family transcriptional regulator [Patescibacteria group bacterium]